MKLKNTLRSKAGRVMRLQTLAIFNMSQQFFYGGQAVIEGVMMRGQHKAAVAVRDPQGTIHIHEEPLNKTLYRGRIARTPFLRGLVMLWDAMGLGTKALLWSAEVALEEEDKASKADSPPDDLPAAEAPDADHSARAKKASEEIFNKAVMTGTVIVSLVFGIGLFFVLPAASSSALGEVLGWESSIARNALEEVIKVVLFIGYIVLIGQMNDVKRVFMYHGAEHKTINAYEAGATLTPENAQRYPIEHVRCGTAFLLNVIILSMVVNNIIGRPDSLPLLLLLRILVIPVVAGISYEWLRFTATHADNPLIGLLIKPNLALQRLTTRQPELPMLEVAIQALERVLVSEGIDAAQPVPAELINVNPATAAEVSAGD